MSTCGLYYNSIMSAVSPALAGNEASLGGLPSPSITEMCANVVAGLLQDGMKIQAHKRIMCELMCCCNKRALPIASPGIEDVGESIVNPTRQKCVEGAIDSHLPPLVSGVDNPMHLAEVSYNMQFREPVPLMDYLGGADMGSRVRSSTPQVPLYSGRPLHYYRDFNRILGRTEREFDPAVKALRALNKAPRWRRPDVVVTRNPNNPIPYDYPNTFPGGRVLGNNSNILSVFEMKFPGDSERPGQFADYRTIAGGAHFEVLTTAASSCNCQNRRRQGQGAFEPVSQPFSQPFGEQNLIPAPVPAPAVQPQPGSQPSPSPGNSPEPIPVPIPLPGPVSPPRGPRCIKIRGRQVCF